MSIKDSVSTRWRDGLSGVILEESICGGGYISCSSSQQNMSLEHFVDFKLIAQESSAVIRSISVQYSILHISRLISEERREPASICLGFGSGKWQ